MPGRRCKKEGRGAVLILPGRRPCISTACLAWAGGVISDRGIYARKGIKASRRYNPTAHSRNVWSTRMIYICWLWCNTHLPESSPAPERILLAKGQLPPWRRESLKVGEYYTKHNSPLWYVSCVFIVCWWCICYVLMVMIWWSLNRARLQCLSDFCCPKGNYWSEDTRRAR